MASPTLTSLHVSADPGCWRAAGVALDAGGRAEIGGVTLQIDPGTPEGLRAWGWAGLTATALDGVPVVEATAGPQLAQPLGLTAVDHVVLATGDLDRTVTALDAAGLDRRRIRDAGKIRQAFYLAGPALVEVAGPAEPDGGGAALWGITFVVADLDAAAAALGELLGAVRDAVQPGRRIATVRREAGLGVPVALMTPRR